jgi:AcrR family transcriptional regulator
MSAPNRRPTARHAILAAAARLVLRDGVSRLTLEAVAAEAGVSKGGLLYHFKAKEALIRGMVAAYVDGFDAEIERLVAAAVAAGEPEAGRWARAYLRASFDPDPAAPFPGAELRPDQAVSLLAAIANDPRLLAPVREQTAAWQARIERDGLAPGLATAIRLTADGLAYAELFGFAPPSGDLRRQVLDTLLDLTLAPPNA